MTTLCYVIDKHKLRTTANYSGRESHGLVMFLRPVIVRHQEGSS